MVLFLWFTVAGSLTGNLVTVMNFIGQQFLKKHLARLLYTEYCRFRQTSEISVNFCKFNLAYALKVRYN